ncbi:ABC transporter ATP-binding protein [Cellulomonas fengjieae]|uniref:ABC transporter ATP-binding protein n=1 Tax=Cellulomonas fengjieae TaxID=2819978 RepID=A0ABS3SFQ8_9CELL|nr:ABC transporter ATP-binding protein [Cellulomonas fengjieae]MBO3084579.1 ABC transporter ATP-binding protein [Cellulomonas fengjieae]MBO3103351.1 ABC transporter ATP-binding protein [Cellulomonas fengjieae]QVI67088.1 ABC transporter ATP-binding protein [Cellulomonas fengjieae]
MRLSGPGASVREVADDAAIAFEHVSKSYASDRGASGAAVDDLSLAVSPHEVLVLVGPSGCGKSTTLRMANRLVEPTSGRIMLEGEDVTSVEPVGLRRRMGYVIQNVGLFPHRTVAQNVATVPGLVGWDRKRTAARVEELLALVGLDPDRYARRFPHELSGGERQRVGVARALATDPPVLLMDEPFGAVDPVGRRRLQTEFARIQRALGITVMLVTHDIDEAVRMADRVAVLSTGARIEQLASPLDVVARPATPAVADLVGRGRTARLLALGRLERPDLDPPVQDGTAAPLVLGVELGDVLAALVGANGPLPVHDEHGRVVGSATPATVVRALDRLTEPDDETNGTTADGPALGTLRT